MLVGGCLLALAMTAYFAPILWLVILVVVISGFVRYRKAENQALIWTLAVAAERGIPLESAARSFAAERHGYLALRTRNLADYLDAAVPLSLALERSGLGVSADVRLAADLGENSGTFGASLHRVVDQMDRFDRTLRSAFDKAAYFGLLVFVGVAIVTFLMIKIVPIFEEMFVEFEMALPRATIWLISVSRAFVEYWYIFVPFMALAAGIMVMSVLSYAGVSFQGIPLFGRLTSTSATAMVLQMLSVGVSHRRPISETLDLIAGYTRHSGLKKKLGAVSMRIAQGVHWCDALHQAGLIKNSVAQVFHAAERAGNLDWALAEMADTTVRRSALRTRAVLNVFFPGLVVLFGIGVFFVAVSIFSTFSLIRALT